MTLALIVETRQPDMQVVNHANGCLSRTHAARLLQSVIIPGRPGDHYEVRFGEYAIRSFNPDRILYWATRGHSNYPVDLKQLAGWAALERDPLDLSLIDWVSQNTMAPLVAKWGLHVASDFFLYHYYSETASALAQQIRSKIKREALVLESAAMVWIGIETLLNTLFLKIVSYFTWKSDSGVSGWATYEDASGIHANFPPQDGIAECRRWLAEEFGFTGQYSSNSLTTGVETYCRFMQRAHGHRLAGRHDEAFLHFAIALDLLLGTEGRSSESVAQRAALLVYRQFQVPLEQQIRQFKDLYNARSKYVHEGRGVSAPELDAVERLCTEILWTLLAVSSRASMTNLEEWIRLIDYFLASVRINKTPSDHDFASIGVPAIGHVRRSPIRVLERVLDDDEDLPRRLI